MSTMLRKQSDVCRRVFVASLHYSTDTHETSGVNHMLRDHLTLAWQEVCNIRMVADIMHQPESQAPLTNGKCAVTFVGSLSHQDGG